MIEDKLVEDARSYCFAEYGITPEIANHQEIYDIPQIQTVNILLNYGYDDNLTQCIALLNGITNDPKIITGKIKKKFGYEISNGVYLLSPYTLTEKNIEISLLALINPYMIEKEDIYRLRLSIARKSVKKIKLAQIIQEISSIDEKPQKKIKKQKGYLHIVKSFYLPMARLVAPEMAIELEQLTKQYHEKLTNLSDHELLGAADLVLNHYD